MEASEVISIGRDAIYVLLVMSAPLMLVSLIVGLAIALFQALTQIQEMTLTFVPKIVAIFVTLMIALPFMLTTLTDFTKELSEKIIRTEYYETEPDNPEE